MALRQTPEGALSYSISAFMQAATQEYIAGGATLGKQGLGNYTIVVEDQVSNYLWDYFYQAFKGAFLENYANWANDMDYVVRQAREMGFRAAQRARTVGAPSINWNDHAGPAVEEVVQDNRAIRETRWCS